MLIRNVNQADDHELISVEFANRTLVFLQLELRFIQIGN